MKRMINGKRLPGNEARNADEHGWALLGLLLALGIMSIMLVSTVVPNVQMAVQRDKEVEMIYRGEQMAAGIARYYNGGKLGTLLPAQFNAQPLYGYLTELAKLKDGVMIGARETKLVRSSAMIDPISNSEWDPVRIYDPRIGKFLQAFAAERLDTNIQPYLPLAGPLRVDPLDNDPNADKDPLAHLFSEDQPGHNNFPIIGVAPKKKGTATRPYYGLDQYEDWIFFYIPPSQTLR